MTPGELARAARCTQGPITALRRKGLIRSQHRPRSPRCGPTKPMPAREKHLVLNPDQEQALRTILDAMNARRHQTILIHGVTGSGKTEVYIQAIQEVIHFGRQAIVLVPEISLTPQTVERFRQRFGAVAVLHSHLSDAERHWHWQRIAEGAVSVVVGARSAIFAPTPNLGLIVLDEEHESSFKQESVAALSRPRRGRRPGGGRRDSAGARLGHAVAGKLAPGADRASTRWSRCRAACWIGRCRRSARSTCAARSAAAGSRAAPSAGSCTPP